MIGNRPFPGALPRDPSLLERFFEQVYIRWITGGTTSLRPLTRSTTVAFGFRIRSRGTCPSPAAGPVNASPPFGERPPVR
jgi:hypothetical protein